MSAKGTKNKARVLLQSTIEEHVMTSEVTALSAL